MWLDFALAFLWGVAGLYDAAQKEKYEARKRWENKREEVKKSVEEHQRNIENHMQKAQRSYDFHFLVDLHYSSSQVAGSAYQLLDDARKSFSGMSEMLMKSKEQRASLRHELKEAKRVKDKDKIHDIIEQLKMVEEIRKNIFEDRDRVKEQQAHFLAEVQKLNNQTRQLKEFIRDRCDIVGRDWYDRLETRKRARQISEGKR